VGARRAFNQGLSMTSTHTRPRSTDPVELPDPDDLSLTSPPAVDAYLEALEAAREQQLTKLPPFDLDPATAAYRDAIERILRDVRGARVRVASGVYGVCTRCRGEIPSQRLQRRPWVPMCTPCAQHAGS
jgi:hypothetical protein